VNAYDDGRKDFGCPVLKPYCLNADLSDPAVLSAGDLCTADIPDCFNTEAFAGVDGGCDASAPICVGKYFDEPSSWARGEHCKPCVNDQASELVADTGCPNDKPLCLRGIASPPLLGRAGDYCAANNFPCFNTAGGGDVDQDCTTDAPICVGPGGRWIDSHCYGERCAACVNAYDDGRKDFGCPVDKPYCLNADLSDPAVLSAGDLCTADILYCFNTEAFAGVDGGCTVNFPICVDSSQQEPSFMVGGTLCAACVNDQASELVADNGCSAEKPVCVLDGNRNQPGLNQAGMKCYPTLPYDIELDITRVPAAFQAAFSDAVTRWESVIVGDIPDVYVNSVTSSWCGPIALKNIDDLLICATVRAIDGPYGILGAAGPEFVRTVGALPVIGGMEFDQDDMAFMQTQGIYENVIVSFVYESQQTID
jgi:hypothetical protein